MHKNIKKLDIETINNCNASCPQCLRTNETGSAMSDYNDVLDFDRVLANTTSEFWKNLEDIHFNGNTGDNIAHPNIKEIIKKVVELSPRARITVATNGSLRNTAWWEEFGSTVANHNVSVVFGIDGLEDTHHLYRVGTSWQKVIDNAQAFIKGGGSAVWQMIPFKHNQHQINQCKELSQKLKFKRFFLCHENRFPGGKNEQPVYFRDKITHTIEFPTDIDKFISSNDLVTGNCTSMEQMGTNKKISCDSLSTKWLAIYADATVWPCCYLMGWHKSTHQTKFYPLIRYHLDKVLKLDLYQMSLYNNKLEDILNGDTWQNGYEHTFATKPNPICLQQCSI